MQLTYTSRLVFFFVVVVEDSYEDFQPFPNLDEYTVQFASWDCLSSTQGFNKNLLTL